MIKEVLTKELHGRSGSRLHRSRSYASRHYHDIELKFGGSIVNFSCGCLSRLRRSIIEIVTAEVTGRRASVQEPTDLAVDSSAQDAQTANICGLPHQY